MSLSSVATPLTPSSLPRREPAAPDHELERLEDWGLLNTVLTALTAEEFEACPGALVVHIDGRTECVEAEGCPPDPALHAGIVSCADLPGCSC